MLTPDIVEGVMTRVIGELGRVHFNQHQEGWGPEWGAPFSSMDWNLIQIRVVEHKDEDGCIDKSLNITAFGSEVWTWLDSKRPFYHSYCPAGWSNAELIAWAEKVFAQIH